MSNLAAVRNLIAATVLADDAIPSRIGEIELRPHQRRAATRLAALITSRGGALLAEPVGVGKTYTALAVASQQSEPILVVAPAALYSMWHAAAERCDVRVHVISHESLSRGRRPEIDPGFVIVDESHRVRNPATARYALLAEICQRVPLLLVTATPIQNARDDLAAQLALFLGRTAWSMSEDRLTELVVRDSGSLLGARPLLDGPHRIELPSDDDCLDQLVALPAPIPARDESVAGALLTYGLIHQWSSSRGALLAALMRRRARGLSLMSALESGRNPTRVELAAWLHEGETIQLAFPEIVTTSPSLDFDSRELVVALDRHNAAIHALIVALRDSQDRDAARADALRTIRRSHPGERIIAFCQYAETVAVLRTYMARDAGIAALTASGARVAGGRIARDDVLDQFQPDSSKIVRDAERIDLLITTDLLSEGLNLQEASVIVHLDLPWNPARLDQRVGRALRLGSRHPTVTVYAFAPPTSAERLLRIETRLKEKLSVAQRTIGVAGRILPSALTSVPTVGIAERRGEIETLLRSWRDVRASLEQPVAAVRSRFAGFVALVRTSRGPRLIADVGRGIETNPEVVAEALRACAEPEADVDPGIANLAVRSIEGWLGAQQGAAMVDLSSAATLRSRRAAINRVALAIARAPRHHRLRLAPLADAARSVVSSTLPEGAERVLETLVRSNLPDEAWLRTIAAFGELNSRLQAGPTDVGDGLVALILLQPERRFSLGQTDRQ